MADEERFRSLAPDPDGTPAALWALTPTALTDLVKLIVGAVIAKQCCIDG